ncbi:hypothetical protein VSX64_14785 [Aurantimonas sp. C2-6-R+9]|nr:hypothetical protein [Aurantimonas sp. C2-6-R+9]
MGDKAAQCYVDGSGFAVIHGDDLDVDERHLLVNGRHVGDVAGQAIQRLHHDDLELSCLSCLEHLPQAVPTVH